MKSPTPNTKKMDGTNIVGENEDELAKSEGRTRETVPGNTERNTANTSHIESRRRITTSACTSAVAVFEGKQVMDEKQIRAFT